MAVDKAFMSWSGGKDSALALHKTKGQGINVEALVTTVNTAMNRISMHGVRRELLEAQAASIGLPLYTVELPEMPDMKTYEDAVRQMHRSLVAEGFTQAVFGDIFLEDLKAYREELLFEDGLRCFFPLWKKDTKALLKEFVDEGFKAITVCINNAALDKIFCGRLLDASFVNGLPASVDPCGENGEYHSFVYAGPVFSTPVVFKKGEVVFKEYAAPIATGEDNSKECFATPKAKAGFFFQDLLLV